MKSQMKVAPEAEVYARLRDIWDRRTLAEDTAGRQWYPDAWQECNDIAARTDIPRSYVVAACAALSPVVSWSQNLDMLRTLARKHGMGHRFRNPGTYPKFARDAWACLNGDIGRCSGPKRSAFAVAIGGSDRAVVVDRWIARAVGHHSDRLTPAAYAHYTRCLIQFARDLGEESVRDVQAILWVVIRNDTSPGA
jgi:hypothetical protein